MSDSRRVVAIGGGHGLAASLRAIRRFTESVTAVVSTADDGGSSGRLREDLHVVAVGDLRKCLGALASPTSTLAQVFEHRFSSGDLAGHPLGNLVLAGFIDAMDDPVAGLDAVGSLLGGVGRVLPATESSVVLRAEGRSGPVIGQVAVGRAGSIATQVYLEPPDASVPLEVLTAIKEADQIVIGPGSLFTSVLAATVALPIRDALATTSAQKVYVCNLRAQAGETDGFDVGMHLDMLANHGVTWDVVLCDTSGPMELGSVGEALIVDQPLALSPARGHDPVRLAEALWNLMS